MLKNEPIIWFATQKYGIDNHIWNDHIKRVFNISKRPQWKLEDFYVPHILDLVPVNYPFK